MYSAITGQTVNYLFLCSTLVDEFKYLGVLLDSQLSFRLHIDLVINKISYWFRILYFINCFTRQIKNNYCNTLNP